MAGEQGTKWEGEEWSVGRKTESLVSFSGPPPLSFKDSLD